MLTIASAAFLGFALLVLLTVVPGAARTGEVPGEAVRPPTADLTDIASVGTPSGHARRPHAGRAAARFPTWHLRLPNQPGAAPIDREGIDAAGFVGVPANVHRVGWFAGAGPIDGADGTVVLVGHVNWVGQGTGYLGVIPDLPIGSRVVTRGAGAATTWRVSAIDEYSKAVGLPQTLFTATGPRRLVLITCGGSINSSTGSYDDNVVVTAVPVTARN